MSLQRVQINNFRGGLNTRDGPFDLMPNESPDLLNVTLTSLVGQLRMREGMMRLDAATISFPSLSVAANLLEPLEKPLSDGGKFSTVTEAKDTGEIGFTGKHSSGEWLPDVFPSESGARWNVVEQANPAVSLGIAEAPEGEGRYIGVWACLAAAAKSGYFVRWSRVSGFFTVTIEKWVAGTRTTIRTLEHVPLENGNLIGITVRGSVVSAWKNVLGTWNLIGEAVDGTYTTGYTGFAGSGAVEANSFSFGEVAAPASGLPNESIDYAKQAAIGTTKRFLMLSINGHIYSLDNGGVPKLLHTGTAGTIWDFVVMADATFKDWVWCVNGVDAPQKWDGEAAATVEWKATKGTLPKGSMLVVWEDRMMISGETAHPQRVFFSEFADPEATVNEYGFVDVRGPDDDLDSVTALAILGARLYVFHRRNVFLVSDPVKMNNRRLGSPGAYSRFQVTEMEDKLYFFNPQGIWGTAGVTIAMESGSINNWFPQHLTLVKTALEKVRLIATRDTYPRLLLTLPTQGSETPNIMIEMIPHINFRRIGGRRYLLLPAFMLHSFKQNCLATWNPLGTEELIVGGTTGKMYRLFHGTSDDGEEIQAHWTSAYIAIQEQEPFERVRRLNVLLSGDAIADVLEDFKDLVPKFSAPLPNPISLETDIKWEGGEWQGGQWGLLQTTYRFARVRPEARGRYHAVRFRNLPGGEPFFINAAEVAVRGGKEIT